MSALSSILIVIGLLSLFHAAYSAHEHSALSVRLHTNADLPLDIKLETVVAITLSCFGLVLGADRLKPIAWNVWAGEIEQAGGAGNPYRAFEDRIGYLDIRKARKEFADWARGEGIITKN